MHQPAKSSEPLLEMIVWHDATRAESFHAYSSAKHSSRMPCLTRLSLFLQATKGKMGREFARPGNYSVSSSVMPSRMNMQYEQDSELSQSSRHTVG